MYFHRDQKAAKGCVGAQEGRAKSLDFEDNMASFIGYLTFLERFSDIRNANCTSLPLEFSTATPMVHLISTREGLRHTLDRSPTIIRGRLCLICCDEAK